MPEMGLIWAFYRSNREWMSERGSLGVNLLGGRDEIGHGGAYPRAAGEVACLSGVARAQCANKRRWTGGGSLARDAWRRWMKSRGSAVSPGARSTAVRSPGKKNRGRGSAARHGEGRTRQQRRGVGSGGVRGGRLRSKPVAPSHPAAGTDGGGAAELRWSWR